MATAVEQLIGHLKQDIAVLHWRAKKAEEMLPHVADKYAARCRAAIEARWKQAMELSTLLPVIEKNRPQS